MANIVIKKACFCNKFVLTNCKSDRLCFSICIPNVRIKHAVAIFRYQKINDVISQDTAISNINLGNLKLPTLPLLHTLLRQPDRNTQSGLSVSGSRLTLGSIKIQATIINQSSHNLTFRNRASYIQDGHTATLQTPHFIYFFNKYMY